MRRFIVLIVTLVVPLQFAWASAASAYGHLGENVASLGMLAHAHDDHAHDNHAHGHGATPDSGGLHGEGGHQHADHSHPVFSSLIVEPSLSLGLGLAGGPRPHPPETFLSRTPPLLDRPPLARA